MDKGRFTITFIAIADFMEVLRFFMAYQNAVAQLALDESDYYLVDFDKQGKKITVEWANSTEEEERAFMGNAFADIVAEGYEIKSLEKYACNC
jgi:hypothetical protein